MSENKLIQTFDEYLELRYKPLETEFLKKVGQNLSRTLPTMRKYCLQEWVKAISLANEVQRREGQICAYMSLSVLATSLIDDKPILQVDFYNEEWVFGESWARYRMDVDFLFKHWQDFKIDALDDRFFVRSKISKVEIKSLFWGTLDKIIFLFACYVKYFAPRLSYYNEFDDLVKAESFYITCGTYLDWQNRVYAVLPEVDLLNPDANEDTTFQHVANKNYHNQKFSGINLRGGHFEDCVFDNFTFENLDIVDVQFTHCRFVSTKFVNLQTAGCDLFECYFKNCTFENCSFEIDKDADEYFAPMRMYHCYLLNIQYENCNFENAIELDCYYKE